MQNNLKSEYVWDKLLANSVKMTKPIKLSVWKGDFVGESMKSVPPQYTDYPSS